MSTIKLKTDCIFLGHPAGNPSHYKKTANQNARTIVSIWYNKGIYCLSYDNLFFFQFRQSGNGRNCFPIYCITILRIFNFAQKFFCNLVLKKGKPTLPSHININWVFRCDFIFHRQHRVLKSHNHCTFQCPSTKLYYQKRKNETILRLRFSLVSLALGL